MWVSSRWERVVEQLVGLGLCGWVGGSAAVGSTVSCRRRRAGIFMGHSMSLRFRVRVRVVRMELELYGALNWCVCVLAPSKIEPTAALVPHRISFHYFASSLISHLIVPRRSTLPSATTNSITQVVVVAVVHQTRFVQIDCFGVLPNYDWIRGSGKSR